MSLDLSWSRRRRAMFAMLCVGALVALLQGPTESAAGTQFTAARDKKDPDKKDPDKKDADKSIPAKLDGTTWVGTEDLEGFGALKFSFNRDKTCTMVDAKSTLPGRYTYDTKTGKVVVMFADAHYEGTVRGSNMSGSARLTIGDPKKQSPWKWEVKLK